MSTRYGIGLALEPGFTSRVYRARQLICGQYASWAAEMHMVYLPLSGYFECPEPLVTAIDSGLAEVTTQSKAESAQSQLSHNGVGSRSQDGGHIFLDFDNPAGQPFLTGLSGAVGVLLEGQLGPVAEASGTGSSDQSLELPLTQHAQLSPPVFEDAVEFARAVVADIQVPASTRPWRLLLLRFQSEAAGDDWRGGRWAADLRWELLASHLL